MASSRTSEVSKRVVTETQRLYASLLAQSLDEKQLARPSFRLIQDIAKRLITETRTLRNVFNPSDFEGDTKTAWDKRRRVDFVQKLIDFAANHKQPVVGCVAAKLVAGLEPNKANELLQALAKIALARVSGQEGTNPNRPRTFTKPSPPPVAQKSPPRASRRPSETTAVAAPANARGRASSIRPPDGMAATNSRGSPHRDKTPARTSSGSSSTRNASASSVVSGTKQAPGRQLTSASRESNLRLGSGGGGGCPRSPQQVADEKPPESLGAPSESRLASPSRRDLDSRAEKQSRSPAKSQAAQAVTSESDLGKQLPLLRASLKTLTPVLLDINQLAGELKDRLAADCPEAIL